MNLSARQQVAVGPRYKTKRPATLPSAKTQSEGFRQARASRRSELAEDYLELIADLLEDGKEARQVDIATRLGVSQPTVAKTLARLAADGMIERRPYRSVFLTKAGSRIAKQSRSRHELVERFLCYLGVSPSTARLDAESMEHCVSDETLDAFRRALTR